MRSRVGLKADRDCIEIRDLEVFAYHGVYEDENKEGQYFYISADLYCDLRAAGTSDDLLQTVSYAQVCEDMYHCATLQTYSLIERLGEEIAASILRKYERVEEVSIRISKPYAPVSYKVKDLAICLHRKKHQAYLGIGSNMGDRKGYLEEAVKQLQEHPDVLDVKCSEWMETMPYGVVDQAPFLNGAIALITLLSPEELLVALQELEQKANRQRLIHWGPRTLDLDILLYDDLHMETERLTIPHVDMVNRRFVLEPLSKLAPYAIHPVYNKTISQLFHELLI